jgi:TPR repeat protein
MLGFKLMHGLGVKADTAQALQILQKAAEAGDAEAMAGLAWAYGEGRGVVRDYVRSREWSEKAAAIGHAISMLMVGRAYDYGCGVTQDLVEARRWYEKAKASFDPRARMFAEQALLLLDRPDIHRVRVAQVRARGCMPPTQRSTD